MCLNGLRSTMLHLQL
uniref:Uncharacterized protein n=1 Tax=Anguilla anguilla TaxID=7936 RepID=A0A0E9SEB4_ANGAN